MAIWLSDLLSLEQKCVPEDSSGGKVRPTRKAGNITAIYEPMSRQCGILNILQPYRPPRLVMGIALLFYSQMIFQPHRKYTYGHPRTITWITVVSCM
jgi:hypothetical protein